MNGTLLHGTKLNTDDEFALRWNILEDVRLKTTQQMRTQQIVQSLYLLFLRDVSKLLEEALQITKTNQSKRHVEKMLSKKTSSHIGTRKIGISENNRHRGKLFIRFWRLALPTLTNTR